MPLSESILLLLRWCSLPNFEYLAVPLFEITELRTVRTLSMKTYLAFLYHPKIYLCHKNGHIKSNLARTIIFLQFLVRSHFMWKGSGIYFDCLNNIKFHSSKTTAHKSKFMNRQQKKAPSRKVDGDFPCQGGTVLYGRNFYVYYQTCKDLPPHPYSVLLFTTTYSSL